MRRILLMMVMLLLMAGVALARPPGGDATEDGKAEGRMEEATATVATQCEARAETESKVSKTENDEDSTKMVALFMNTRDEVANGATNDDEGQRAPPRTPMRVEDEQPAEESPEQEVSYNSTGEYIHTPCTNNSDETDGQSCQANGSKKTTVKPRNQKEVTTQLKLPLSASDLMIVDGTENVTAREELAIQIMHPVGVSMAANATTSRESCATTRTYDGQRGDTLICHYLGESSQTTGDATSRGLDVSPWVVNGVVINC